jgi:hypothetical protein
MAGPLEAAAHQHLVEAVQPAEPAAAVELDVGGVDDLLDRRDPAEGDVATAGAKHVHSPRRDHRDGHPTVVDLDQLDAFLLAAVQDALLDRERRVGGDPEINAGDRPFVGPARGLRIGQNEVPRLRR